MDEYISREATIKRIKEVYCVGCNSYHGVRCRACGTGDAIDIIDDFPAADVAPVTRCKDCANSYEDAFGRVCAYGICVACTVPADFYCASSKPKEGTHADDHD